MNPSANDGHHLVPHPVTGQLIPVPYDPLTQAAAARAAAAAASELPDDLRCKYKSTRCVNQRARKRNGELHNFCQLHRERANANQRNSEQRKRQGQTRNQRQSRHASNQETHSEREDKADAPTINIPEPLQPSDSPHPGPTVDELEETALLLSFPENANTTKWRD